MTIGPEPITRMCEMSVRFGTTPPLPVSIRQSIRRHGPTIFLRLVRHSARGAGRSTGQRRGPTIFLRVVRHSARGAGRSSAFTLEQVDEAVEQVGGIVRAGRGLRVVLHAERADVPGPQPLDDVV